ncbi:MULTISPECIES: hypothetical protein [Chryseobacterium]|uniref:hypothetical protein n=1 Tax=Chryseobacterium TaxID=59732 RepID=UPI0012954AA3|nr:MULTISPECIES: hypothetical protein [Chryseobacterium]MDR6920425.1 hypothetical protein [Chryseobacterium sp. 2987]
MNYLIKKTNELSNPEIEYILKLWDISEWMTMNTSDFRFSFRNSEFHFLVNQRDEILALSRLNFDFTLDISGKQYIFAEIVGLVSAQEKKGYGSILVKFLKENTEQRNLEVIGFCLKELRPFYQQCDVEILKNKAKNIMENNGTVCNSSEDDDILIFHLSDERKELLKSLGPENNAYFN